MLDVISFLLMLVLTCGALGMMWQLRLYPTPMSKLEFAFSSKHRKPRQDLHAARRRKSNLKKEHRKKEEEIERPYKEQARDMRAEIRELERKKEGLRQQGQGRLLAEVGKVRLYERSLEFPVKTSQEEQEVYEFKQVSLAGLDVEIDFTPPECSLIGITYDGGRYRPIEIPLSQCSRGEVKSFAKCIKDAVAEERESRSSQRGQEAEWDAQIKNLGTKIDAVEEARRRERDKVRNAHSADPRQEEVDAAWKEQCDAWEALTGRRPKWRWRWW